VLIFYGAAVGLSYVAGKPDWSIGNAAHTTYMNFCTLGHVDRDVKCLHGDTSE